MSVSATFIPYEGEELENSQYIFENLPPIESVYADAILSGKKNSQLDTQDEIFNSPNRRVEKNISMFSDVNNQKVKFSKAHIIELTHYYNIKPQKIYHLSCPWKGWSGIAKIVPKSKVYTATYLTFKNKYNEKQISLDDRLNFSPYQPRQVAYFY